MVDITEFDIDYNNLYTIKDIDSAKKFIGQKVLLVENLKQLQDCFVNDYVFNRYVVLLDFIDFPSDKPFVSDESLDEVDVNRYEYLYDISDILKTENDNTYNNYRPFKWNERGSLYGSWVVNKGMDHYFQITEIMGDDQFFKVRLGSQPNFIDPDYLLKNFKFADGRFCGVVEA